MNWKPPKVFYGWWIVAASVVVALYTAGAVFYGFTAVFEPIANELGWSYTQISLAASLRGVEMGLLTPLFGILVDRWGPRRLIAIGAVFSALGLISLSRVTSLGMFYVSFVLVTVGLSATTNLMLTAAVGNWFRRKIGIANGITVSGFGFGGLLVPVLVKLIEIYEWRKAITILAFGMLAIVLPLSLVFRHKPEQYGYLPDGQAEEPVTFDNSPKLSQAAEIDVPIKQALRTRAFWQMALAFAVHVMLVNSITTHVMPYLSSVGIARSRSSLVATAIPVTSIGGRLGLGWLGDKVNRKFVAVGAFAIMGLGLLCFGYVSTATVWLIVPFLILFGIGYGGINATRPSMVREYFGRANFGTIFGLMTGFDAIGTIIGPTLAGWVYDTRGSYQSIWLLLVSLPIAALIFMLTLPPVSATAQVTNRA